MPRLWGILFRASALDAAKTCRISSLGLQYNAWYTCIHMYEGRGQKYT
jgi:hypothetical protein